MQMNNFHIIANFLKRLKSKQNYNINKYFKAYYQVSQYRSFSQKAKY